MCQQHCWDVHVHYRRRKGRKLSVLIYSQIGWKSQGVMKVSVAGNGVAAVQGYSLDITAISSPTKSLSCSRTEWGSSLCIWKYSHSFDLFLFSGNGSLHRGSGLVWDDVLSHVVLALQSSVGKHAVLWTASVFKSFLIFWLLQQWQHTAAMPGYPACSEMPSHCSFS